MQAYQDAVKYFEKELSKDPRERAWIRGHTSMTDVLNEVSQAQKLYGKQSDKHVRVRQCLTAFASTFTQYSGVFDVLAQADPLHAGIAWGAIKFVFMVS